MSRLLKYICITLSILIGIFLMGILIYEIYQTPPYAKPPMISVESTEVKAYNLAWDNNLFIIINFGIRVINPNPEKSHYYFGFSKVVVKVTKSNVTLAEDVLHDFGLRMGEGALIDAEAVGIGYVALTREVVEAVRADVAAGEGRVDLILSGRVGLASELDVTCEDVVVDFSQSSTERDQRVYCKVDLTRTGRGLTDSDDYSQHFS